MSVENSASGLARLVEAARKRAEATSFALHFDEACRVCGAPIPNEAMGWVREHEYESTTDIVFPWVQCPDCLLVYLYPRPHESELGTIYPRDYYAYHLNQMSAGTKESESGSFVQRISYQRRKQALEERLVPFVHVPEDRPLRVLDIGCGVGAFLDMLRELYPGAETWGVDLGEEAVAEAKRRGHRVFHGRFEDTDLPLDYFDAIISIHVIEHVAQPDLFLEKCRDIANQDGAILIETPNTDTPELEWLKKQHWGGYHAPRHWYLFRRETLERLAARIGLGIERCEPYPVPVFWVWSLHSLTQHALGRRVADAVFPPVQSLLGGFRSFVLVAFFVLFETATLRISGRASSLWVVFKKPRRAAARSG